MRHSALRLRERTPLRARDVAAAFQARNGFSTTTVP